MGLKLHAFDGRDVRIDPWVVASISEIHIGARACTRISLRSGDDVVVSEPEYFVRTVLSGGK